MRFRTEYTPTQARTPLSPQAPATLLGSCFAENITKRMRSCLWDAQNPFGVLFNPFSIARAVELALYEPDPAAIVRNSIFESDGYFHSWLFDSGKSAPNADTAAGCILNALDEFRRHLSASGALIITFGTAWCYFLADKEEYVVANCHKQPQKLFCRRRVSTSEITGLWSKLLTQLHQDYPELKIIFTVSPVRHLRDGFEGNARSKATLTLAVEELCQSRDYCIYFPAFEIMNDDLRDYRFYAEDLTHPSDIAVEYIWEKFKDTYLDDDGLKLLNEGEALTRRAMHRGLLPDSEGAIKFRNDTIGLIREFNESHPTMLTPEKI